MQRKAAGGPNTTGARQVVGDPGSQGDIKKRNQSHGGCEHRNVWRFGVESKGGGEQVESAVQQPHHALQAQARIQPSIETQQPTGTETCQVGYTHPQVGTQLQLQVIETHKAGVRYGGTQGLTSVALHIGTEQYQGLVVIPAGFEQFSSASYRCRKIGFTGQSGRLNVDAAPGYSQLPANIKGSNAASDLKGPISHGLDPRHGKGHLFKLDLQVGVFAISCGLRAKQPQASATTHHSLISHLGVELLKQKLLKVEQHGGIDVTNLLADELQLSTPETQKSVSDRLSDAAAH